MGPILGIPDDFTVMQVRVSVLVRVVIMVGVKIPAPVMKGGAASGTDVDSIG